MKLFIFKATGHYFGGALGIIADTAEEAANIVNTTSEKLRTTHEEWQKKKPKTPYIGHEAEHEEWWRNTPKEHWIEPVYVKDEDNSDDLAENRFVLAHEYELAGNYEKGQQFVYGWGEE